MKEESDRDRVNRLQRNSTVVMQSFQVQMSVFAMYASTPGAIPDTSCS